MLEELKLILSDLYCKYGLTQEVIGGNKQMMNSKKVINGLLEKIEYMENRNGVLKIANKDLLKEIEKLEKEVISYKGLYKQEYENFNKAHELARKNRDKVNKLEKVLELKEIKVCELNTKLCRAEGKLDKIKNMYRTITGEELE